MNTTSRVLTLSEPAQLERAQAPSSAARRNPFALPGTPTTRLIAWIRLQDSRARVRREMYRLRAEFIQKYQWNQMRRQSW